MCVKYTKPEQDSARRYLLPAGFIERGREGKKDSGKMKPFMFKRNERNKIKILLRSKWVCVIIVPCKTTTLVSIALFSLFFMKR